MEVYVVYEFGLYSNPNVYAGTDYEAAKQKLLTEGDVMEIWRNGEMVKEVYRHDLEEDKDE
jgi:hypothetical protein